MAATRKKTAKGSRRTKKTSASTKNIQKTLKAFLDEAEEASDKLLREVKEHYETLSHRISAAASSAADTAASVTERQLGSDVAELFATAVEHVKEAGEASTQAISEGFDVLRQRVRTSAAAAKKKPRRKKSKASKRKAGKKKATSRKKTAKKKARKKATKKKSAKKKPASKKKRTRR